MNGENKSQYFRVLEVIKIMFLGVVRVGFIEIMGFYLGLERYWFEWVQRVGIGSSGKKNDCRRKQSLL